MFWEMIIHEDNDISYLYYLHILPANWKTDPYPARMALSGAWVSLVPIVHHDFGP